MTYVLDYSTQKAEKICQLPVLLNFWSLQEGNMVSIGGIEQPNLTIH